ncbi:hypothetical protein FFF34_001750 [Inquilinus sp. KBS0705]|nr:hypothetical protein FFF34_001750 [Inquilinus sp. KBS0705]
MDGVTIEKADYIITYYSHLLPDSEKMALKHHRNTIKSEGGEQLTKMYLKTGRLTDDPLVLNYLSEGYVQFILNCAGKILRDNADKVFFNLCPNCSKLARTPEAKQCRFCGFDWH